MHVQAFFYLHRKNLFCVQTGGKSRTAYLRVERHADNGASATQSCEMAIPPALTGKIFIPPDTQLSAANYALARNATFSTNLDTKRRVFLERHSGDVTRVNTLGALRTRHNRHHAAFGTQSTIIYSHDLYIPPLSDHISFHIYLG